MTRLCLALVLLVFGSVCAVPAVAAAQPSPVEQCVVDDDRLAELSGLAGDGEHWYAVGDGGTRLQVAVLRRDCTVQRVITAAVDPFDVEDLARGTDGSFWLADIGDNARNRDTIAVHVLPPQGPPSLFRLTYPDGPHDAEALALSADGVPYVITKELFGGSGVYRPVGALSTSTPTPLERVATLRVPPSDTEGGPTRTRGVTLVTGAATSADGRVLAVRTYTDAFLYPVIDGDLVAAFAATPVRVPLPGEPQGEAIAFDPDGSLLSASEQSDSGPQPIRSVAGADLLVAAASPAETPTVTTTPPTVDGTASPAAQDAPASDSPDGLSLPLAVLIAVGACIVVGVLILLLSRRSSRP